MPGSTSTTDIQVVRPEIRNFGFKSQNSNCDLLHAQWLMTIIQLDDLIEWMPKITLNVEMDAAIRV